MQQSPVSGSVRRVVHAARAVGLDVTPYRFPDGTSTAEQAASAVGVDTARIVKSLVFEVDGEPVLALVRGRLFGELEVRRRPDRCPRGVGCAAPAHPTPARSSLHPGVTGTFRRSTRIAEVSGLLCGTNTRTKHVGLEQAELPGARMGHSTHGQRS